ncbi:hypothetical protein Ahu01nite_035790 [Winogradskya humida]|uniref:DUF305 domain-containing protein n=1 Tax=Winogradskya humida TaxID=113566 RepID=A0ABQ3ZPG5_9ACTN|nr:hypothetical protein Ahu01nite_035790 [Actinoplanes humidus]
MNRHSSLAFVTAWALTAALGTAACGSGDTPAPPASAAATPAPSAGGAGFFGGTDLAWVEINIAMDEELLPLLALAPANGSSPQVKALAAELTTFHQDELTQLRALHDEAKLPSENPHKGMPMPGMVTPEQVTAATKVRGAAFDKLLTEALKAHFEQGVNLAGSEGKAGLEPRTKELAVKVISTRQKYLKDLG